MKAKFNLVFYVSLIFSVLFFIVPVKYVMGVYSPNILGWTWIIVCFSFTLISFVLAGVFDVRKRNWSSLKIRILILLSTVALVVVYWFFRAHQAGNV